MAERILVCDDEAHILHAVAFKLKAGGYEIVTANNGREAIEWLEASTPDFVITDCQMPEVDGIGLCRYRQGPGVERPVSERRTEDRRRDDEAVQSAGVA